MKTTLSFCTGALLAATMTVSASAQFYQQTNLVSDLTGTAQVTDSHLVNPWGISLSATSPIWVSDAGTSASTVYSVDPSTGAATTVPLVVTVPMPSGQVHNGVSTDFILGNGKPAAFIFASLGGSVYAWNSGAAATSMSIGTAPAAYTGIALGNFSGTQHLYVANPAGNRIDVYDNTFAGVTAPFAGKWIDPSLPAGLVPFNIANINGDLFVSYAPQSPTVVGLGVIDKFDTSGNLLARFATGDAATPLYNPWGMVLAPASFGKFSNALLVGNFNLGITGTPPAGGPGYILAFDLAGNFLGTLKGTNGNTLNIDGLWGMVFGNGATSASGVGGGSTDVLYFAAGIQNQRHGLFGSLTNCAGPVISHALASPDSLWPPNNKFVPVAIDYDVTDACDATPPDCTLSVTVSDSGGGVGNLSDSFVVENPHLVELKAARNGGGNGRTYSIQITCTDKLPLSSATTVTVTVAHDQGRSEGRPADSELK